MKGKECSWNTCFSKYGGVLLRIVVGLIFLFAGYSKLFSAGGLFAMGSSAGFVGMISWLGGAAFFFAWLVAIIEFVGGIFLIAGFYDKYVAPLLAFIILVAIITIHWDGSAGFATWWNGIRYQLLLFVVLFKFIGSKGCGGILNMCKTK